MLSGDLHALDAWLSGARILLVDDEAANLEFLRHVLDTEGYAELITLADPVDALDRFAELGPDLVMVDLRMPQVDGFEFMARVQAMLPPGTYLPILVATGDHTPETRRRALAMGARDFLTKPLSPAEVRLRVRNLLETRFLHEQLRDYSALLEQRVAERTRELEEARLEILYRLARAAEFRDDETGQHTLRVGRMAGRLAQVLGHSAEAYDLIARAAPLHDVGKIGIPDAILLKPARLDPHEMSVIQKHTVIGANILSGSRYPLLQLAEEIALSHHERWDGKGYPFGLTEEQIPLSGRIVAVADAFDSLTHSRPYKRAWTVRDALAEIEAQAGTQFDASVVEALLRIAPEAHLLEAEAMASPGSLQAEVVASTVSFTAIDPGALATQLRGADGERDELARELDRLRRKLARHDARANPLDRPPRLN
ncbi:MAG TPA: HD domain-containing phosphohydrolase [Longimicrobiales bacterium]|nr:HD domain-containing phosphohydrolase [Longimicrobiales bacterium]